MNFEERFIMLLTYANALYEINAYKRHLRVADEIIELSIIHNIQFFNGEDIYLKTLFQKAKSFFHLHEYNASQRVATELVKMVPNHKPYSQLLSKCLVRQRPQIVKKMLATGVFLYLLSVLLVVTNILVVKPVFEEYHPSMEFLRKVVFILSILTLVAGLVFHHLKAYTSVRKIRMNSILKQKNK